MNNEPHQDIYQSEKFATLGRMVRLTWKTLGILLLFLVLILIIIGSPRAVIGLDVFFWLVVAGLMLTRYFDIRVFHGPTAENEPATIKDWLRYSSGLLIKSGVFWILAHALRDRLH